MAGAIIWPLVIWLGAASRSFWPRGLVGPLVAAVALLLIGGWLRAGVPISYIAGVLAGYWLTAILLFLVGFAVAAVVRRQRRHG